MFLPIQQTSLLSFAVLVVVLVTVAVAVVLVVAVAAVGSSVLI